MELSGGFFVAHYNLNSTMNYLLLLKVLKMKTFSYLSLALLGLISFNAQASEKSCNFYNNADGQINVPQGSCSWRVYGHQSIVTTPRGPFEHVWINMWGNSMVMGEFTTQTLRLGAVRSSAGVSFLEPRTITFYNKVTVNSIFEYDDVTSFTFTNGICGNYKCQQIDNTAQAIGEPLNQGEGKCPAASIICEL